MFGTWMSWCLLALQYLGVVHDHLVGAQRPTIPEEYHRQDCRKWADTGKLMQCMGAQFAVYRNWAFITPYLVEN